ncbi:MAG: GNAT family N-acetyltransferase [Anaerolineae bacterium]|nr:GNAT family N-acetyltransferase [Anaerolineae bacterium]
MIELSGEHVVLHTLEREQCRELWQAYEPVLDMPSEPLNPGLSIEGADRWFEEMQAKQGKEQLYLGIYGTDGRLLGDVQLANIDWRHRSATLGCGLARRADRGHGYGTEASLVLLRYAFDHLDLVRISAATAEYNRAGRRCLEKLGFVEEGRERQAIYCGAQRWDRVLYGLLRTDPHLVQQSGAK